MDEHEPQLRMLRRVVYGLAAAAALVALGAFLLELGTEAVPQAADDTELTVAGMGIVLGWMALAAAPVIGLRIGGLGWRRALWTLPLVPLGIVLADLLA